MRLALVLLLLGCASAPHLRDTTRFRECKEKCEAAGSSEARVVEDEDSFQCFCKRPPLTAARRSE